MFFKNKTGIQITSKRIGKIEKEFLKYILDLPKSSIGLDLGGGNGYISLISVLLQKKVYFYDLKVDWKLFLIKKILKLEKLFLLKKDLRKTSKINFPKKVDFVYSARFLHYLSYEEAEILLRKISAKMKSGGKIFITVSGLDSAIGKKYSCKKNKIFERYCYLEKDWQERFQIAEKITLYKKKELVELIEKFFSVEEVWESDFKNIFIIGVKK